MTTLVKQEQPSFSLEPRNFAEAKEYATLIANSELAPKDYRGKPGNVIIAVQMGRELGLAPLQALRNISVINGRASVWGDALLAICKKQPDFEDCVETLDDSMATCTIKRRGQSPVKYTFTMEDAKKAKLIDKDVWKSYPKRMLQMRARGFACRDAYPDALLGLISAEEAQDIPAERHMGEVHVVPQTVQPRQSRTEIAKQALGKTPEVVFDAVSGEVYLSHAEELAQLIAERSASLMAADDEASLRNVVKDLGDGLGGKYSKDELAPLKALFRARLQQVKDAQLGMEPGAQG